MPGLVPFAIAFACAALMGYAIQRGATCMVVAVTELLKRRRATRLVAMAEAALWVAAGLAIAGLVRMMPANPPAYGVTLTTLAGGALLGVGAFVNGGCVFGSIARLGSGEAAFVLTPLGFFSGAWLIHAAAPGWRPALAPATQSGIMLPWIAAIALALYALARTLHALTSRTRQGETERRRIWAPHEATLVIAVAFVVMLLAVGRWSYPELLDDLAAGRMEGVAWRAALFGALLAGAALGGYHSGRVRWMPPTRGRGAACLTGGMLMGLGSGLVPGGNDGLLLVGLPFLLPYAWAALGAMCGTIALAIFVTGRATPART